MESSKGISDLFVIIGFLALLVFAGIIKIQGVNLGGLTTTVTTLPVSGTGACELDEATLTVKQLNYVNGTQVNANSSNQLLDKTRNVAQSAVTVDAFPDQVSTSYPASFSGYLMTGDNTRSYRYIEPISWTCSGNVDKPDSGSYKIVFFELSPSFTGYDDGTSESSWNITVGTTKVTSSELKIESTKGHCVGDPRPNPITGGALRVGICINGTAATLAKFNEIKPTASTQTFTTPEYLASATSVKGCYWLPDPTPKCDGTFWRDYWTIDPISNPASGDGVTVCLVEETLYLDDFQQANVGVEDVTALATDTNIGITVNCKDLYFG